MDWAKVKTILIVIFLILNVFLFITNLYTDYDLGFQSDYARKFLIAPINWALWFI